MTYIESRRRSKSGLPVKKKSASLPKLLAKAQKVFNAWIRERDKDKGCISCNGKVEQAGHYFSQGHYSGLRFDELNTNGQCVKCNLYLSGNLIHYRQGLVQRYGSAMVENLESLSELRKGAKYDRVEIERIITKYS